jgi:transposase-like protein
MVLIALTCPYCKSDKIVKNGHYANGKQRYKCNNPECTCKAFVECYTNKAHDPKVKRQIYELTVNGNGTRAIARSLGISKNTVTNTLKKMKVR